MFEIPQVWQNSLFIRYPKKKYPSLAVESILNPEEDFGAGPQRHSLEFVSKNNEIIFNIVKTKGDPNYSHTIPYP